MTHVLLLCPFCGELQDWKFFDMDQFERDGGTLHCGECHKPVLYIRRQK